MVLLKHHEQAPVRVRNFCADGQPGIGNSTMEEAPSVNLAMTAESPPEEKTVAEHETLKYSLLGPSLTKSGQDNVDQQKVGLQIRYGKIGTDICRCPR
jgi:hypothetical protein